MELLVCIINREERLEEILAGFLRLGVTGATIVNSEGMGRVLSSEVPVFAGLQSVMSGSRPQNTMIMSVIESGPTLDAAIDMVTGVCGDMDQPGTGILFTIPVGRARGLAPRLPPNGA